MPKDEEFRPLSDEEIEQMSEDEVRKYLVKMLDHLIEASDKAYKEILENWDSYSEECRELLLEKMTKVAEAAKSLERVDEFITEEEKEDD